jgi:hypothetical protein
MIASRPVRALLAVSATVLIAIGAAAAYAAAPAVTADGVGQVELGATATDLRDAHRIGHVKPGCELAPGTHTAKLKGRLEGVVNFSLSTPHVVDNILIDGGPAKASGVGIGSSKLKIQGAFPHAKFDHDTEDVFGITLVKIPKRDGGKFQFALDVATQKVTLIGVPFIAFCE